MKLEEIEAISNLMGIVSNPVTRTREAMQKLAELTDRATAAELAIATHQYIVSLLLIEKAETERQLATAKGEFGGLH